MKNSCWVGNRIGLVDFWYYGDQEYEFLDGRMLLRGANGSGKSVTMQSFVPLLLDGNMRPERLDPFGSKARKMENYLLEEDDAREERTGYLYMEFKRKESDKYLTFGMGIRARKGKKLETWYFYIQDNRRIGRDFLLYKEGREKLVLTKAELRNRIGSGGELIESQGEYERRVNEILFGFETIEEYRELLSLLIQLRTPKLSKDFKPSVINEILSRSLQTLSEEDLRPMSEAIENMDSMETNLRTLQESARASEDIRKVYDKYNMAVLLEKAQHYTAARQEYGKSRHKVESLEKEQTQDRQDLEKEAAHYQELMTEYSVLEEEYARLKDSDAARLKEREGKLQREEEEQERLLAQSSRKAESKQADLRSNEAKLKGHMTESEMLQDEMEECFVRIKEYMETSAFSEWQFVIQELKERNEEPYDFAYQEKLLKEFQKQVAAGIEVLRQEAEAKKQYGDAMQELDAKKDSRDAKEREWQQYERMVREQKGELTEAIHVWSENNQWIKLDALSMQQTDRRLEAFQYEDDYSQIREFADIKRQEIKDVIGDRESNIAREIRTKQGEREHLLSQIEQLQQAEEVEPERAEAVLRSRELLKEMGIPTLPFYKAIDFDSTLGKEQCSRLEAAFYQMGILDALVVDPDYRKQIISLDKTVCDKYLFTDAAKLQKNLSELFSVENGENDIVLSMKLQNILSGIGYGEQKGNAAWIDPDGHYALGILEGTVSYDYESKYIGATARERHRLDCIRKLQSQVQEIEKQLEELEAALKTERGHLVEVQQEFAAFPGAEDLKTALKGAEGAKHLLELAEEDVRRQLQVLQEWELKLKEIQRRVQEICGKTGLPGRLDVYQEERDNLELYQEEFYVVREKHGRYLHVLELIITRREQVESLEQDLDDAIREQGRIKNALELCRGNLASVREQLQLTDYEEIRERLEHCVKRLDAQTGIPKEKEASVERQGQLKNEILRKEGALKTSAEEMLRADAAQKQWEIIFTAEYRLSYVSCDFIKSEDMYDMARKVTEMLYGQLGSKTRYSLSSDLQQVYHEKKGILSEYQLIIQNDIFGELVQTEAVNLEQEQVTRIDIKAKYRGVEIPFLHLVTKLREDAEELGNILSEKDRELFEDILSNTISKKIRLKIQESNRWVSDMNRMMESMETSSGLTLSLKWQPRKADKEGQLDTKELVDLLQTDAEIMRQEDVDRLSQHFRSCIRDARKLSKEEYNMQSFHVIMKDILDYRKWFEFQLFFQKAGEKKKEMTDRMFFTFSGGEKAMSMYVPLFSAVVAKYKGANEDAPKIISLDEAFAGVDEMNIKDMFRLMIHLELNFIINSQVLWGDYDTVPSLAIYHLIRPLNAKCVTVMNYVWNGKVRTLV